MRELRGLAIVLVLFAWFAGPSPLEAGACGSPFSLFWEPLPGEDPQPNNCLGGTGFRCYKAENLGTFARLVDSNCDPTQGPCVVQLGVNLKFPGLEAMIAEDGPVHTPIIDWKFSDGAPVGKCGLDGGDGRIFADLVENFLQYGGVTCANSEEVVNTFDITVTVCEAACPEVTTLTLNDGGPAFTADIGCPQPPLVKDCPTSTCNACLLGVPVDGGGAQVNESTGASVTGPGARLRYAAEAPAGSTLRA